MKDVIASYAFLTLSGVKTDFLPDVACVMFAKQAPALLTFAIPDARHLASLAMLVAGPLNAVDALTRPASHFVCRGKKRYGAYKYHLPD